MIRSSSRFLDREPIEGQLIPANHRNLDWLYDEVHLCESGNVEHIIEFEEAAMRIECVDFTCSFEERR